MRHRMLREDHTCQVNITNDETLARLRPGLHRADRLSGLFRALADKTRLRVIYALSLREMCVCDIAALLGSSKARASYHLRFLSDMGLLRHRKEGKFVFYTLADQHVHILLSQALEHVEEQEADKE